MRNKEIIKETDSGYENDGFEKDIMTYKESREMTLPEQQKQAKEQ